jgi:carbamoylphosphate synthase small subunit
LEFFLRRNFITAVSNIDTIELARHAAQNDIRRCAIVNSPEFTGWDALTAQVKEYRYSGTFPAAVKTPFTHGSSKNSSAHLAICDFGSSNLLTRLLTKMRIRVTLLPPYDAATIFSRGGYDAMIIPNGAGSPRSHPGITQSLRSLIDDGVPMLGFGLGFRFLAIAAGAKLAAAPASRRGAWLPVTDLRTGAVLYTWQSHALSLEEDKLPEGMSVTRRNAHDGAAAGFTFNSVSAVHFLPCSNPRLGGTGEVLSEFFSILRGGASNAG